MRPSIENTLTPPPVEPTPEERKNGWTAEKLGAYIAERNRATRNRILGDPSKSPRRLVVLNSKTFNPHRW